MAGTPIVVTQRDSLHQSVAAFLAERPADRVILLGGTGALTEAVQARAAELVAGAERVFGGTRDETAAAIARGPWGAHAPSGAVLVNGYHEKGWAYALSGAVLAARTGAPQLYVTSSDVPGGTSRYLGAVRPSRITVVGPAAHVTESVREAALALAPAPGAPPPTAPPVPVVDPGALAPWSGPAPDPSLWAFIGGQPHPYRLPSCTIPYVINPDGAPAHAADDVAEALRRISAVSGLEFRFDGFRPDDVPTWEMTQRRAPGHLGYTGYPPLLIAYGTAEQFPILSGRTDGVVGFGGPVVVRRDGVTTWASGQVVLGTEYASRTAGGFGRHNHHGVILLHEIGHAIGLGHPTAPGQMMSGLTSRTDFGDGDRYALTALGATCRS